MFIEIALWAIGIVAILCAVVFCILIYIRKRSIKGHAVIMDEKGIPIKSVPLPYVRSVPPNEAVVIIRRAVFYQGMIYLKERPSTDFYEPGRLDIPFEFYYSIGFSLKAFVDTQLKKFKSNEEIEVRHSIRYMYHDDKIGRNVFLYFIYLENEKDLKLTGGKLWTLKQIEQNINKGVFSSLFENEFEHYKVTIPTWEEYHS